MGRVVSGLGRVAVTAIGNRDFPLIQGAVLITAAIYVLVNLLVDLSYAIIDPRIRSSCLPATALTAS